MARAIIPCEHGPRKWSCAICRRAYDVAQTARNAATRRAALDARAIDRRPCITCGNLYLPIDAAGRMRNETQTKFCSIKCKQKNIWVRTAERRKTDPEFRVRYDSKQSSKRAKWYAKTQLPSAAARKAERANRKEIKDALFLERKRAKKDAADARRSKRQLARWTCKKHGLKTGPPNSRKFATCLKCAEVTAEKQRAAKRRERKACRKKDSVLLRNAYVKRQIREQTGLKSTDIPAQMVEAKRAILQVKRLINKELRK